MELKKTLQPHHLQSQIMSNKNKIIKWISRSALVFYTVINIDFWISELSPKFHEAFFSKLKIFEAFNLFGGWLLLIVIGLIVLHRIEIFIIEKKVIWSLTILFLFNLLLMYLEIKRYNTP